ncbi:uncharacterized protein YutE (UPF0331/DUF86 family) [Virgibacillus natechei]|uniref:Uncharacterized protein YutE (UPF0331/DUF86 family) n=1 Tax=Virgibacillus natechei TaxID=1216297 RepID=A0ABS4IF03_9BACI|nr:DUF86 domain-containing protein [Virgibacillus natechei]MBP1969523.1 uncharacterized protein YutE (UPF0331/DUF86 family) [Virgibacillus natechei]UZD11775.1 DUF86 domain-containing protein [Virgibacillus natechei]
MYFVDQSKIEQTLLYMEEIIQELSLHRYESLVEKLSLERMVHVLIESTLDVGNMMIDGFIMRDPGGYEDIIDILVDEQVLPREEEQTYKEIIRLRKMVVHDYIAVDHDRLKEVIFANKHTIEKFSTHIRTYLDNEFGVANAFSNES